MSNLLPFSALHVTVGVTSELSVATASVHTTKAVGMLKSVSIVWLVGQITVGASVSTKESGYSGLQKDTTLMFSGRPELFKIT